MVEFTQNINRREEAIEALKAFVIARCDLREDDAFHIEEGASELSGWRTLSVSVPNHPSAVVEYIESVPEWGKDSDYLNPRIIGPGFVVSKAHRREVHLFGKSDRA